MKDHPTEKLFEELIVNRVKNKVVNEDFHDWAGYHDGSVKRNYDTMVITQEDNGLENGTSEGIRKYFNEITSVGIDPSIPNQQLLFLMNVP